MRLCWRTGISPTLPTQSLVRSLLRHVYVCEVCVTNIPAALFEAFYERIIIEVLGRVLGAPRATLLAESPMLLIYTCFDRLILSYAPELNPYIWRNQSREQLLISVLRNTTRGFVLEALPRLADVRRVVMKNLFFGGKLPLAQLLGIDRETTVLGSRGSIVQGRVKVHRVSRSFPTCILWLKPCSARHPPSRCWHRRHLLSSDNGLCGPTFDAYCPPWRTFGRSAISVLSQRRL